MVAVVRRRHERAGSALMEQGSERGGEQGGSRRERSGHGKERRSQVCGVSVPG